MTQVLEIEDGAHSELGPSAADRWIECPGSVLATRGIPDVPSPYAISGTASHTLSEWCRKQSKRAQEFLGTTIRVKHALGHTDMLVDQERVDSVQEFSDRMAEQQGDELIEERVSYQLYVPGGFGTLDGAKLREAIGRITDLKDGEGVQKWAEKNPQLMLYALGVYLKYNWIYDFKKFVLAICQPRLHHYDEWEISLEDLLRWVVDVAVPAAVLSQKPGAPFKAGDHCQFCRIRGSCRTRTEWALQNALGASDDLDQAVVKSKEEPSTRLPTISNDELAKVLRAAPGIIKFLGAAKTFAAKEIMEGRAVGNFKFVDGRSNRSFIVGDSVVVEKAEELGAKKDALYSPPELLSVAQIEKIVGAAAFAPEKLDKDGFSVKKEAGPMFALIKKTKGAPTLVPGEDKREAVSVNPTDVFSELGDE